LILILIKALFLCSSNFISLTIMCKHTFQALHLCVSILFKALLSCVSNFSKSLDLMNKQIFKALIFWTSKFKSLEPSQA
ncbi:hypothetical protein BY996DRAFT_7385342, partial [Phakopsora pachyrhizi]